MIYFASDLRSPALLCAFALSPAAAALFTYAGSKLFPYEFKGFQAKQPGGLAAAPAKAAAVVGVV